MVSNVQELVSFLGTEEPHQGILKGLEVQGFADILQQITDDGIYDDKKWYIATTVLV